MGVVFTFKHAPEEDLVRCSICKTQIGFVEDHTEIVQNGTTGVFNHVFNVQLIDSENYLRQENGNTVADIYCVQCGMPLGLKLIAVPEPTPDISKGKYLMKLDRLVYWNDDPMFFQEFNDEQAGGANIEQVTNEQAGVTNVVQVPNEQDGRANVGQVPNEQDGGAIIGQVPNEQHGGANIGQVPNEQDGGANIGQVPNEQDGGANIGQIPNDQDVDQLADGMGNIDLNLQI